MSAPRYNRKKIVETDEPPEDHVTVAAGVSRGQQNGKRFRELRAENMRRQAAAQHHRMAYCR